MVFPRYFDEELFDQLCPEPCPCCKSERTPYSGFYILLSEELGPIAEVRCGDCSYEFLFTLAALDPDKAYLFAEEEWEKEIYLTFPYRDFSKHGR